MGKRTCALVSDPLIDDGGRSGSLARGYAVVVPARTFHNVLNTSKTTNLKLYTNYSLPSHPDGQSFRIHEKGHDRQHFLVETRTL
jgi:mannose-6-phosphate isomerase-like protein (cupin superfamily)